MCCVALCCFVQAKEPNKDENSAQLRERTRIAMLSLAGDNVVVATSRNNLHAFGLAMEANPRGIIMQVLGLMTSSQLKTLGDVAGMGNHKYTIRGLSKAIFATDEAEVVAMTSAMGYITEAHQCMVEWAFAQQYQDMSKTKFRDDVMTQYGLVMKAEGVAQAAAGA
jgi:hypothetical protein